MTVAEYHRLRELGVTGAEIWCGLVHTGPWTQQQRGAYGHDSRHTDTYHGQAGEHSAGH